MPEAGGWTGKAERAGLGQRPLANFRCAPYSDSILSYASNHGCCEQWRKPFEECGLEEVTEGARPAILAGFGMGAVAGKSGSE